MWFAVRWYCSRYKSKDCISIHQCMTFCTPRNWTSTKIWCLHKLWKVYALSESQLLQSRVITMHCQGYSVGNAGFALSLPDVGTEIFWMGGKGGEKWWRDRAGDCPAYCTYGGIPATSGNCFHYPFSLSIWCWCYFSVILLFPDGSDSPNKVHILPPSLLPTSTVPWSSFIDEVTTEDF